MSETSEKVEDLDFLGESYEIPRSGGSGSGKYLKFGAGVTHFRVLSPKALKGWEYFTQEQRPVRLLSKPAATPANIRVNSDGKPDRIKHFWAMAVWDYSESKIKILSVTQATVLDGMLGLIQDPDFGHPRKYDLKVERSGDSFENTKYSVRALPKPMPKDAIEAYEKQPIYLEALLHDADPFSPDSAVYASSAAAPKPEFLLEGSAELNEIIDAAKASGYDAKTLKAALNEIGIEGSKLIPHDRASEVLKIAKDAEKAAKLKLPF